MIKGQLTDPTEGIANSGSDRRAPMASGVVSESRVRYGYQSQVGGVEGKWVAWLHVVRESGDLGSESIADGDAEDAIATAFLGSPS